MIHVHQSITCYHFAMSWAETPRCKNTFRSSKVVGPTPKVQWPDKPINWESSVLGTWLWPYKLPLRLVDFQQLESVAMFHVPISNTLNFPIPKFPLISASRKPTTFFWSCSPSPQCSWREVPLEWSYDYPSRTWDFWWDFLWNLRGSNITISTSQAGAPK